MKLKLGRRWLPSTHFLLALIVVPLAFQVWMVQHVTVGSENQTTEPSNPIIISTISASWKPPKLFIGILGDTSSHVGLAYRQKQRELFGIWNDTRFCHLTKALEDGKDCLVIYSFILGGHNASSPVLPYHLGTDDRPLTLESVPVIPRMKDVNGPDVTILNIRENMNDGKTPTFVHFAVETARKLGASYIAKCDSDSTLRWNALLRFLHMEFPSPPIPTVIGMFRHKAFWPNRKQDERAWKEEWYSGMHLYLAGQLYVMSVNVAEQLVDEAQKWYTPSSLKGAPYFAGHEDHDAFSMIQQRPYIGMNVVRWIGIAKHVTFWEHPVKGGARWDRILKREQMQAMERIEGKRTGLWTRNNFENSIGVVDKWRPSLLVLFLESPTNVEQQREAYLREWTRRNGGQLDRVCGVSQYLDGKSRTKCDLYRVFVVGTHEGRMEILSGFPAIETIDETWELPIRHDIHNGLGLSTLTYIIEHVSNYLTQLDYILLVQAKTSFLNVSKWTRLAEAQPAQHHAVVLGDMRDKHQWPAEFVPYKHEAFWHKQHDNTHFYLGSDVIGLGTNLVGRIVEQAGVNETLRANYTEGKVGHDLTMLAYLVPKSVLHWVPVTKSMQFWETIEQK